MKNAKWLGRTALSVITIPGILTCTPLTARAGEPTERWVHILGIQQPGDVVGAGTGQIVGNNRLWTVRGGHARIDFYNGGEFYFTVKGLVLAAGDGTSASDIGTPGV